MRNLAYALINLNETNKLLPRHRNKCQNSGKTFKYVTTCFRLDACSSFNNIEGSANAELFKVSRLLCIRWPESQIQGK